MLDLRPIKRDDARPFIRQHHRHHGVPTGFMWAHGVHDDDGELVGVATVGRPVARALDDGLTCEVTRLCTNGAPNACSMLYGAARCRRQGIPPRTDLHSGIRGWRIAAGGGLAASVDGQGAQLGYAVEAAHRQAPDRGQGGIRLGHVAHARRRGEQA